MKVGYYAILGYEEYKQIEYGISVLFPDIPEIASCARTRMRYPAKYSNLCSMYDIRAIEDCIEGLSIELVPDSIVEAENEEHKTIYIHWPGSYVSCTKI